MKGEDEQKLEDAMKAIGMEEVLKAWNQRVYKRGFDNGQEALAKQCGFRGQRELRQYFR